MNDVEVVREALRDNERTGCHTYDEYTAGTCACRALDRIEAAVLVARAVQGGWSDDPPPHRMQWGPLMANLRDSLASLENVRRGA